MYFIIKKILKKYNYSTVNHIFLDKSIEEKDKFILNDENRSKILNILTKTLNENEINIIKILIDKNKDDKIKTSSSIELISKNNNLIEFIKNKFDEFKASQNKDLPIDFLNLILFLETLFEIVINHITHVFIEKDVFFISLPLWFSTFYYKLNHMYDDKKIIIICEKILGDLLNLDVIEKKIINCKINWAIMIKKKELEELFSLSVEHDFKNEKIFKYIYINKYPTDWAIIDDKGVFISNYDNNVKLPFISLNQKILQHDFYSLINKKYLDKINNLQKIGYILNIDLFISIFEKMNLREFYNKVKKDLFIESDFDYEIYFNDSLNKKINKKKIKNYDAYILKLKKQLDIIKKKKIDKNNINIDNKNVVNNIDNIDDFNNISLVQLIILWFIYDYNSNDVIHHLYTIEFRGRISLSGIINYVSDKLYRFLIHLPEGEESETKYYMNNENIYLQKYYIYFFSKQYWKKKINSFQDSIEKYTKYFLTHTDDESMLKDIDENKEIEYLNKMNLYKLIKFKYNTTISLDATSSLLQIIGVLTKNISLMTYTNVLHNSKQLDIYIYVIEKILHEFKENKLHLFVKTDHMFISYYKNRKIVKYACMTWLYGSTPKYIATEMKTLYKLDNILLLDLISIVNKIIIVLKNTFPVLQYVKLLYNSYIDKLPVNIPIKYNLIDKVIEYNISAIKKVSLEKTFPSKSNLYKKWRDEIINLKKDILDIEKEINTHNSHDNNDMTIDHSQDNYNNYSRKLVEKKKLLKKKENSNKMYLSMNIINFNKKDNARRKRSFFVNAIHSFDSQICIKMRDTLLSKYKIKSLSVHDCFIINLKNYEYCIKEYNNELSYLLNTNFYNIIDDLTDLKIFTIKVWSYFSNNNQDNEFWKIVYEISYFIIKEYQIPIYKLKKNKIFNQTIKEHNCVSILIEKIKKGDFIQHPNVLMEMIEEINTGQILNKYKKYIPYIEKSYYDSLNDKHLIILWKTVLSFFKNGNLKSKKQFYEKYNKYEEKNTLHTVFCEFLNKVIINIDKGNNYYFFNKFYLYYTKNINKHLLNLKSQEDFNISDKDQILKSEYSLQPE